MRSVRFTNYNQIAVVLTIERERKGNFIQVSEEFDLSKFKLTEKKCLKSGVKSKGNWTQFELSQFKIIWGSTVYKKTTQIKNLQPEICQI